MIILFINIINAMYMMVFMPIGQKMYSIIVSLCPKWHIRANIKFVLIVLVKINVGSISRVNSKC